MTTRKKSRTTTRRIDIADPYHAHGEVQVLEVAVVVVGGTATKRRTGGSYLYHSRAEVQGLAASVEGGAITMRNVAESEGRIVNHILAKTKTKNRPMTRVNARSLNNMEDRAPGLSEVDPRHSLRMEEKEETERM
jgi:hypothetical protein